jgi:hypothetical protein
VYAFAGCYETSRCQDGHGRESSGMNAYPAMLEPAVCNPVLCDVSSLSQEKRNTVGKRHSYRR